MDITKKKLAEAEEMNQALRKGQVDAVIGEKSVSMVRLREVEQELKDRQDELERKHAELVHRTEELERANEELESFSYAVSHDLRGPLRHIRSFAEILNEDFREQMPPEAREYLDRMSSAAELMSDQIGQILDISRVSRMELERREIDLSAMANQILERFRAAEPDRSVELTIEPGLKITCDHALIGRVMENLLSNAWKYTNSRRPARISLGTEKREGHSAYVIRDNGTGFDMKYADRLFTPFQRLHSEQEFGGTGVGLSVVQRIIHRHGGTIWAESTPGEGAAFYFTLGK